MPLVLACDRVLAGTILALTLFGLMMVYSTTGGSGGNSIYVSKQFIAAGIGFGLLYPLLFFDYRRLRDPRIVYGALIACAVLLVLAALLGTGANTRRFLRLGVFSLQPSELAKPATVLFLAYYLERNRHRTSSIRTLLAPGAVVGSLALLILIGKDFGTMACLAILAAAMLFMARVPVLYLALASVSTLPLLYFAVWNVAYRRERIVAFLDPEADPLGAGFQILQSRIAVGSGGILGQGWMAGRQKMDFLPEAHTDFIFAMVGEELGLLGTLVVVAGFYIFLRRGLTAAMNAPDRFGLYLAGGITVMVVSQAMLNLGVVLGMLPTKGMPLPFISYGGTSLITVLSSCGVLLAISRFKR